MPKSKSATTADNETDEPDQAGSSDTAAQPPGHPDYYVQSLERGLAVIRAFDSEHPALTLSEVARAVGMTRAAARRFLLTLVDLGYSKVDGRQFSLGPRVLELGYSYLSSLELPELAHPHMERLVGEVKESSSMCIFSDDEIVYVARVPTRRIMTVAISVGTRFPAYNTSMGRVFLAAQSDEWLDAYFQRTDLKPYTKATVTSQRELRKILRGVAEQGYATVEQQLETGLRSIAVPIRSGGSVVAAMNVSVQVTERPAEEVWQDLLPPLQRAQAAIELDLTRLRRIQRDASGASID